jgi:hypothetical protein
MSHKNPCVLFEKSGCACWSWRRAVSTLLPTVLLSCTQAQHAYNVLHCCHNVPLPCRLNRSFICLVDNARELQASLVPEEAGSWSCVWDKDTSLDWETYLTTALTGTLSPQTNTLLLLCPDGVQWHQLAAAAATKLYAMPKPRTLDCLAP